MKLKSIQPTLGQHTCTRCQSTAHEGWEICVFDGSCWYVCEKCMRVILLGSEVEKWKFPDGYVYNYTETIT